MIIGFTITALIHVILQRKWRRSIINEIAHGNTLINVLLRSARYQGDWGKHMTNSLLPYYMCCRLVADFAEICDAVPTVLCHARPTCASCLLLSLPVLFWKGAQHRIRVHSSTADITNLKGYCGTRQKSHQAIRVLFPPLHILLIFFFFFHFFLMASPERKVCAPHFRFSGPNFMFQEEVTEPGTEIIPQLQFL
ncbi:hypothetical protein EDB87DRAFT_806539 [Lactarius vividus]|nr:hypothetical protein EDB87DRAFT_806539 [Lactarius vividus]